MARYSQLYAVRVTDDLAEDLDLALGLYGEEKRSTALRDLLEDSDVRELIRQRAESARVLRALLACGALPQEQALG